jgi:hypothetical protein
MILNINIYVDNEIAILIGFWSKAFLTEERENIIYGVYAFSIILMKTIDMHSFST